MKIVPKPKMFLKSHLGGTVVRENDNDLMFPDDWDEDRIFKFVENCDASRKIFEGAVVKAYEPTSTEIALVKTLVVGKTAKVEDFGFYMIYASDTLLDLAGDKCTKALLDELAPQFKATEGKSAKSALINHGQNNFGGASFDAVVLPLDNSLDQFVMWVKVYVPDNLNFQGNLVKYLIDTGCLFRASIQFKPGKVTYQEIGDKYISILDADANNRAVAIEISWVYHGAVMDAAKKDLNAEKPVISQRNSNMAVYSKTLEFGEGNFKKSFTVKTSGGENPTVEGLDALEAYTKSLVEDVARLTKAEHESKKPLVDGIIALQKKLAMPEDTEAYLHSLAYGQLDARSKMLSAQDLKANPKSQATKADAGNGTEADPEAPKKDDGKSVWAKMLESDDEGGNAQ